MRQRWTKRLALLLSALLWMPAALAANDVTVIAPPEAAVTVGGYHMTLDKQDAALQSGQSHTFSFTMDTGYRPTGVQVSVGDSVDTQMMTVNSVSKTATVKDVTATIVTWPERTRNGSFSIQTGALTEGKTVKVTIQTEQMPPYIADITAANAAVDGGKSYEYGETATLSVIPNQGYRLTKLSLTYGTVSTTVTSSTTWNGLKITWSETNQTAVTGELYDNLTVAATVEQIPVTHKVTIQMDNGLKLINPGSTTTTVNDGDSLYIRVNQESGYLLGDLTCQYGKSYASWAAGQTYLTMGNTRIPIKESNSSVTFTLPEIHSDYTLYFTATYDENNIPITIDEGTRINIDSDSGDTVARGDDVEFTISTTSNRYAVQKITLKIGSNSATVSPDNGEIRVGGRTYAIEDKGNGKYVLYVDNIREPVTVSAISNASGSVSRPTLTIQSSSNMTITKSVSSSQIYAGDAVTFYFTPSTNYQIDEITVKIGTNSKTVGADNTSVSVSGTTYEMRRNTSGVVSLYLTDIRQNVTVSGRAYYAGSSTAPGTTPGGVTGLVQLNEASRGAFMTGYPDGTFRPESNITRAEAVVMLYRMSNVTGTTTTSGNFYDVPSNMWCATEVNTFAKAGIVDSGSYFYPNQNITRGELVEMLYRLSGKPSYTGSLTRFGDVTGSNRTAIAYAASRGWVNGYPDGTFRPYDYITRSEVATLMTGVLGRVSGGSQISYTDVPRTYWAYRYIQLASSDI